MSRERVLVGVLTGVVLSLAPVVIAQDSAMLDVEPVSGPPGSEIDLSGMGYPAEGNITVQFTGDQAMENEATVEDGNVAGTALIPVDAPPGIQQIEVCVSSGSPFEPGFESACASADFEVVQPEPEVVQPELTVSPESGTPGAPFELTGSGLPQGSPPEWEIRWGQGNTVVGSASVDADGSVIGAGTVPGDAGEGAVFIAICRGVAVGALAQNPTCFPVEPDFQVRYPEVTPTPTELLAGEPFELSGEEWCCSGERGQVVHLGSGDVWGEVVVDENRSLRGTAVVPEGIDPGEHPIEVCVLNLCRPALVAVSPPAPPTTVPPGECGVDSGSLVVDPASGLPRSRIRVVLTAVGTSPQDCRASLHLGGVDLGQAVELRPGEQSVIDARVPTDLAAGAADLVAIDTTSGRVLASTSFNVEGLTTEQAFPWEWVARGGIALVALLGAIWMVTRSRRDPLFEPPGGPADHVPMGAAFPIVPVRWIEARLYARGGAGEDPVAYFRSGATHRVEVRLGPVQHVEETTVPQMMRVVLTEPNLMDSPQTADIMLRDNGPSTSASLTLSVPRHAASVEGRLLLLSSNRVVQTARLPARVGQPPAIQPSDVAATEAVVRAAGLSPATPGVWAALTVDAGRFPLITQVSEGGSARLIRLPDVGAEAIEKIRHRLGDVADRPNDFASLESEATRKLLVFLANHGRLLRSAVVTDFLGEELAGSSSIQMVSTSRDAYLPLELAYDNPAPSESARVCPYAGNTLRSLDLLASCPGAHDETVVCPLGFWGLSKVIERHAYQPREDLPDGFLVSAQPISGRNRITWAGGIILATSKRVDAHDAGARARLRGRLEALVDPHYYVETWSAWDERVVRSKPSILLLLPHTIYSDELELPGLEIGESDRRLVSGIGTRMIPGTPAIAILLGCETAVAGTVSYEQFPGNLRIAGAAIVIATLTEVLGRHAAPLAERLVMLLTTDDGPMTIVGETVVRLRRQLLAEGMPMVLALAVFGDADWLIGGQ